MADLRLIFKAAALPIHDRENEEVYAYVLWYTPIRAPKQPSKLRIIEKMIHGSSRAGGIVHLRDIKGPCPLSPVLPEVCPIDLDQYNVYRQVDLFYINPFSSHLDFEQFY